MLTLNFVQLSRTMFKLIKNVKSEARKVSWPKKNQVFSFSWFTICCSLISAVLLLAMDNIALFLIRMILKF